MTARSRKAERGFGARWKRHSPAAGGPVPRAGAAIRWRRAGRRARSRAGVPRPGGGGVPLVGPRRFPGKLAGPLPKPCVPSYGLRLWPSLRASAEGGGVRCFALKNRSGLWGPRGWAGRRGAAPSLCCGEIGLSHPAAFGLFDLHVQRRKTFFTFLC